MDDDQMCNEEEDVEAWERPKPGLKRSVNPLWLEEDVEKLASFYNGSRQPVWVGANTAHLESDARSVFLAVMNDYAPSVVGTLRRDASPVLATCIGEQAPIALEWRDLRGETYAPLRKCLLEWSERFGLEPRRWSHKPTWTLDAALRLLLKWHEGLATNELTLRYVIRGQAVEVGEPGQELRSVDAFVFLVYAHVLQLRPWLTKSRPEEYDPAIAELVGSRTPQDIAKAIRGAASAVGLTLLRRAKPGR